MLLVLWPLEGTKICSWRNEEGVEREEPEPHVAWAKVLYLESQGSTTKSQGGWATPQQGLIHDWSFPPQLHPEQRPKNASNLEKEDL